MQATPSADYADCTERIGNKALYSCKYSLNYENFGFTYYLLNLFKINL